MSNKIDEILNKYFSEFLNLYEFKKSDEMTSNMSSLYEYKNKDLKFRILNDRGIFEILISALNSSNFFDIELINYYLKLNDKTKFSEKILLSRLGFENIENIIQNEYQNIKKIFNSENYILTERKLNELGNQRAHLLFNQ